MKVFLALLIAVLFSAVLVIKVSYDWLVPQVFPGMVEAGLYLPSMPWDTAIAIAIALVVIGAINGFVGAIVDVITG